MVATTANSNTTALTDSKLTNTFFLASWLNQKFGTPEVLPTTDFAMANSNPNTYETIIYPSHNPTFDPQTLAMQTKLQALGYDMEQGHSFANDGCDGLCGPVTASAIERFQRKNGLEITGIANVETLDLLQEKFADLPPPIKAQAEAEAVELTSTNNLYGRSDLPRGIRNNNPGNLDFHTSNPWQGQTGVEAKGRHATFETPQHGIRAMTKLIQNYDTKYELDTLSKIINRYAPTSENNTQGYINAISKNTGISAHEKLNLHDPATMQKLIPAMIRHENGINPYSTEVINEGLKLAGVNTDPVFAHNSDSVTLPSATMTLTNS